jgi:hypothetical protein
MTKREPTPRLVRRAIAGLAVICAVVITAPAEAGLEKLFENDYEGRAERDQDTYVGFDVVKRGDAKKVAKVTAKLAYSCTNGSGGRATARARGKLEIGDGEFAGKLRVPQDQIPTRATARGTSQSMTYAVAGKLLRRGKARGTIDAEIRFAATARGDGITRCYSGKVDWRAKRGAEVVPQPLGP